MISRWKWMLKQTFKKLWFRATLFAIVAIITALLSILFKSMIPESVSVKVGAEAVDNILNILASSMLAVTTFSLSIMVTAYGSANLLFYKYFTFPEHAHGLSSNNQQNYQTTHC